MNINNKEYLTKLIEFVSTTLVHYVPLEGEHRFECYKDMLSRGLLDEAPFNIETFVSPDEYLDNCFPFKVESEAIDDCLADYRHTIIFNDEHLRAFKENL